jgi:hypothetical protein
MLSRAEHKQQVLEWHMVEQEQQQGQQQGQHLQKRHRQGAVAGAVVGVLVAVALSAAAAMVVMRGRQTERWQGTGREVGGEYYVGG